MPPIVLFEVIVLNMCIIYDIYIESILNIYTNSKTNTGVSYFTAFLLLRFSICLGIPSFICLALMSKAVWLLSEGQRFRAVVAFFFIVRLQESDTFSDFF